MAERDQRGAEVKIFAPQFNSNKISGLRGAEIRRIDGRLPPIPRLSAESASRGGMSKPSVAAG